MSVAPIVRYMILCDDWGVNAANEDRADIFGLLTEIIPTEEAEYPLTATGLCVFLVLVEVRGKGRGHIRCMFEQTGELIFQTSEFEIRGRADPLDVLGIPVRIAECEFPSAGIYSIQFWYNEALIEDRPIHLRELP